MRGGVGVVGGYGSSEVRFRFCSLSRSLTLYSCLLILVHLPPFRDNSSPLKGVAYDIPI